MDKRSTRPIIASDGYQPLIKVVPAKSHGEVAAGYSPTTSQAAAGPGTPPTQGGSGKK